MSELFPARETYAFPDEYNAALCTGRWRYLERLGEGGLAVVHRALDMTGPLGEVALKVLRGNSRPVHAFELHREAQWSLTRLHCVQHPKYDANAAALFVRYLEDCSGFEHRGCFSQNTTALGFEEQRLHFESPDFQWKALGEKSTASLTRRPYVVVELLSGESLHLAVHAHRLSAVNAKLQKPEAATGGACIRLPQPALTRRERLTVLTQLARACEYLGSLGLVHRDLRACNVQLCRRSPACEIKVLDLGVSIAAEERLRSTVNPAVHVFGRKQNLSGYDWLPWEVRRQSKVLNFEWPAHSFDAFSLGVLSLELLTTRIAMKGTLARLAGGMSWDAATIHLPGLQGCGTFAPVLGSLLGPAHSRATPSEIRCALGTIVCCNPPAALNGRSEDAARVVESCREVERRPEKRQRVCRSAGRSGAGCKSATSGPSKCKGTSVQILPHDSTSPMTVHLAAKHAAPISTKCATDELLMNGATAEPSPMRAPDSSAEASKPAITEPGRNASEGVTKPYVERKNHLDGSRHSIASPIVDSSKEIAAKSTFSEPALGDGKQVNAQAAADSSSPELEIAESALRQMAMEMSIVLGHLNEERPTKRSRHCASGCQEADSPTSQLRARAAAILAEVKQCRVEVAACRGLCF